MQDCMSVSKNLLRAFQSPHSICPESLRDTVVAATFLSQWNAVACDLEIAAT